ncbi:MAG TPA: hypothetical protein VGL86_09035 [Polyangia bacterium]
MRTVLPLVAAVALAVPAYAVEDSTTSAEITRAPVEQPFLYMIDPHGPGARQVLAGYALAFSSSSGAIRPIPGNFDNEGIVHQLSLEVGATSFLRVYAQTLIAEAIGSATDVTGVAVELGARVLLTPARWHIFHLMITGAFLREFGADLGAFGELTGTVDLGRVRIAAAMHIEHIFAPGRDAVDTYAVAGVSVRVHRVVRVGAEFVGQDLEAYADADDDDAEGGARFYAGPDLALSLRKDHLLLTGGVAVQIANSPGVLARAALTYVY